jgi:general secretion pathway protein G
LHFVRGAGVSGLGPVTLTRPDATTIIEPSMNSTHPRRHGRRAAFTLMEILIVIALIALLVGLSVTKLGGLLTGGEKDIAQQFVNSSLKAPLMAYRIRLGSYPTTAQGLQALLAAPEGATKWSGPYIEGGKIPEDPWKRPYQYRCPGTKNPDGYDVFSFGPDGVESADDIGNW